MVKELDYKELELLIEGVTQKVREDIITANRSGTLEDRRFIAGSAVQRGRTPE